jgi:hypothetical protein
MDPALILQIEQLFAWVASGLLKWKQSDGTDAPWVAVFKSRLAANEPLSADEIDGIRAVVDAATQGVLNA